MRQLILLNFLILFGFIGLSLAAPSEKNKSKTYSFEVASYAAAHASKDFLRFELKATEYFFLKRDITGYVKAFEVTGDYVDSQLQNAVITIDAQKLDTNNESRNRKMLEHSFQVTTHPKITVRLGTPIQLNGAVSKVAGSIEIRGSSKPVEINFITKESRDFYIIDGEAELSMTTMSLPDPSSFLMKLHDTIRLKMHFDVKKSEIKNTVVGSSGENKTTPVGDKTAPAGP